MSKKSAPEYEYDILIHNPIYRPWVSGPRPWQNMDENGRSFRKYRQLTAWRSFGALKVGDLLGVRGETYRVTNILQGMLGMKNPQVIVMKAYSNAPTPSWRSFYDGVIYYTGIATVEDRIVAYAASFKDSHPDKKIGKDKNWNEDRGSVCGGWTSYKPNFECIDKGKPLPCKTSVVSEQLTFETDLRLQETAAKAKVPIAKDRQNAFLYNLMDP